MKCPRCNNENRLSIIDYQPLFVARNEQHAKDNNYYIDNEIIVDVKCWDCGNLFGKVGSITYKD